MGRPLVRDPQVFSRRRGTPNAPAGAVYVGRPSEWGNPFEIGRDGTREEVIAKFREWILLPEQARLLERARRELRGRHLVCWCAPEACHADVLLELANG